ncbi:hypothetical protein [Acinetobacter baumannii]
MSCCEGHAAHWNCDPTTAVVVLQCRACIGAHNRCAIAQRWVKYDRT